MTAQLHFDLLEDENRILIKSNVYNLKQLQLIKTTLQFSTEKKPLPELLFVSLGGYEMLLCADNSRTRLQVVKYGSCNTDELRCLGMGRVYNLQVDITLGDIEDDDEHAEECLLCRESIPLRGMRAHMETCRVCVLLVTFLRLFLGKILSLLRILNFFLWNNLFVG